MTAPYSLADLISALRQYGKPYINIFDTTKDPPERYIYKLDVEVYLKKRMRGDCEGMEARVGVVVRGFIESCERRAKRKHEKGKGRGASVEEESGDEEEEEDGDAWLVDAGFANGCDEMIALLMLIQNVGGRWRVVESVPRVL